MAEMFTIDFGIFSDPIFAFEIDFLYSRTTCMYMMYPIYSAPNDAGRVAKRDELEVKFNAEMIHPSQGRG